MGWIISLRTEVSGGRQILRPLDSKLCWNLMIWMWIIIVPPGLSSLVYHLKTGHEHFLHFHIRYD
jgi:hypothetical protein